jgi:hypothetical protein
MATFFFHSGMTGAPTNTNAAGSTLGIIRACLVEGFNILTPLSASVSGGVMTINYAAPHGYEDRVWLRLDGAAGGSIVQRVTTSAGASSLTIPAPGFADGAVAGTLSTRVAPADWEEAFTGTNIGVFRSKVIGPGSTRFFYRVADTVSGSTLRILRGFESMTDVNTGIGPFPTVAQESGDGFSVARSDSSASRPWVAVVDGRSVCLVLQRTGIATTPQGVRFGDFLPYSSADLFAGSVGSPVTLSVAGFGFYVPRQASGAGGSPAASTNDIIAPLGVRSGTYQTDPSSIDGGRVFIRPVLVTQSSVIRGENRGVMHCSSNPIATDQLFRVLDGVTGIDGRVLVVRAHEGFNSCVAFPLDEDWT